MSSHTDTPTDFPFSVLAKTMRKVISDYGESMLERSPNLGTAELREAIRVYLAQNRGILADTEQIIIGSGSEYLYTLLVELLGRDKIYAIESPSYKKIEQIYKASDVSLRNCHYLTTVLTVKRSKTLMRIYCTFHRIEVTQAVLRLLLQSGTNT